MSKKIVWALCAVFMLVSAPALADDHRRGQGKGQWSHGHDGKHAGKHYKQQRKHGDWHRRPGRSVVIWHGHRHWSPPPGRHVKPLQRHHHRHDHHRHDHRRSSHDGWAHYAILALQLVDTLNESQQQSYAWAQQRAVSVPVGESIAWQDSGIYGSITPVRDGADGSGRYCREFQHQITVGGRLQSGYGIACRQPDGAWEIVP